jgi:hypothetical protein
MSAIRRPLAMGVVRRLLAMVVVLLGVLTLAPASAGAAELPGLLREFGSFTRQTGLAVDETAGYMYVADSSGSEAVAVFGPEANGPSAVPLALLTGTGSETFRFEGEPVGVAVDNDPASPSYHDVYVTDVKHNVVDKFKLKGPGEYEYVCQIAGWFGEGVEACLPAGGSPAQPLVEPIGVTVDSNGNVFISSYGPEQGFIPEFDATGKGVMDLKSSEHSGLEGHPAGLAVDSIKDLFVQNYELSRQVVKFTLASLGPGTPITVPATGIAIDPASNDLYVDNGTYAKVFDSSGTLIESFASNPFDLSGTSRGIAVRGSTHEIFGDDGSAGDVKVLGLIKVPDVTQCKATAMTATSAVLNGEVDPLETAGAQYRFEYGSSPSYGLETPFTGIAGNGLMPVSAEVSGLEPGTTYHCRLDGTDTAGLGRGPVINHGADEAFTTLPLSPAVSGGEATEVTTDSVVFHGSVNPGNSSTTYHFEYGKTVAYGTELPEIGIGAGLATIEVEQASDASLEPSTTYHYALVATNVAGRVVGEDHTFTTLKGPAVQPAPVVTASGVSAISSTSVTLEGIVDPKLLRTSCRFKLGTTASYGTEVFASLGPGASVSVVSASFSGLAPGTVYHFRLVAASPGGVAEGPDMTFQTLGLPVALLPPAAPLLIPTPVFPVVKSPSSSKHKPKKHRKAKRKAKKRAKPGRGAGRKKG